MNRGTESMPTGLTSKKLAVCMLVAGFPGPQNPTHGLFNKRAADALAPLVDLTVVQFRLWLPGRKRFQSYTEMGYKVFVICVPYIPKFPNTFSTINARLMSLFSRKLLFNNIQQIDVIHVVNATLGFVPALWKKSADFKLLVQSIGSDLNSEMPAVLNQACVSWLKKTIDAATFNSKQLALQYEKLLGKAPLEKIIYRGVDAHVYNLPVSDTRRSRNLLSFLYIGGLPAYSNFRYKENTKGGHTLMEAWKLFESNRPDNLEVELIFAGPASIKKVSQEWQAALKYPGKVQMPGILGGRDLMIAYQHADVVIVPSMEEGLPNAGMEAACSGCALIGTNVGGIPEIIINNKTGTLVEAGDAAQLAIAIQSYTQDRTLAARQGAQGRSLMQMAFKPDNFAPEYVRLYQELMNA